MAGPVIDNERYLLIVYDENNTEIISNYIELLTYYNTIKCPEIFVLYI